MHLMRELHSRQAVEQYIAEHRLVLGYFSAPDCCACASLKPKILSVLKQFPQVHTFYVNVRQRRATTVSYGIFTIPGILVFTDGRESIREARFVHMNELKNKLDRLVSLMDNND